VTEIVRSPGSGLVFVNTYATSVSSAYRSAIVAAENFFQNQFSNAVTLNVSFDAQPLGPGYAGSNEYSPAHVSYTVLKSALQSHATTADDLAAVNSLPGTDPSRGAGFDVAIGMARILGLAGAGSTIDDKVTLNSSLGWTYGNDVVGLVEHELSEGALGRVGGLGIQSSAWGPLDLFRYSAPGRHDYTGGQDGLPAYFSVDGRTLLTQFHNAVSTTGIFDGFDFGDWGNTRGDAFGPGGPGISATVTATDLRLLDVLGWTPTGNASASSTVASVSLAYNGVTGQPLSQTSAAAVATSISAGQITLGQYIDDLIANAQTTTIPALIVSQFFGAPPTQIHLGELATFDTSQLAAYTQMGVAQPILGPYEALGVGFSDTLVFHNKYAGLTDPNFVTKAYQDAFQRAPSSVQAQHFSDQLSALETMYTGAGQTVENAGWHARGAVIGQMLGIAVLSEPTQHAYIDTASTFLHAAALGQATYGDPLALV
jgi:hypothetical protein